MKNVFLIFITSISLVVSIILRILFILVVIIIVGHIYTINHLKPEEPSIKQARFCYTIKYQVLGEEFENSDSFECYYDGIVGAGEGYLRKWEATRENGCPLDSVRLIDIGDEYYIQLDFPSPGCFMGDFKGTPYTPEDMNNPIINICYATNGVFVKDDDEKELILNNSDFHIIYWYCTPHIVQNLN